jgi:HAD superfamily hydrolase (TIGR01509 family)
VKLEAKDMTRAALLDVDGTLIDNNLLHVLAWRRAFQRMGMQIEAVRILHAIGMGGDQLVPAILGDDVDDQTAERLRALHAEEYIEKKLIDHSEPLPGAVRLLDTLRARGVKIALASSAKREELDRYLALLGPSGQVDAMITKERVPSTKPAPDIFAVALDALGRPDEVVVVGDTVYDVSAAKQLGLPCLCVLTGGMERALLEEAGAAAVYESAGSLADDLDRALALGTTAQKAA